MVRHGETRAKVASLLELGISQAEISRRLAISEPTVTQLERERLALPLSQPALPTASLTETYSGRNRGRLEAA